VALGEALAAHRKARWQRGGGKMIGSGGSITAGAAEYLFVGLSYFCVFGRASTSDRMTSFSILGEERGFRSPRGEPT
jgi:hypothetical protein